MNVRIDIETLPSEDRQPYIDAAKENFKAPSSLTKSQAGADLGITGDELKYTPADEIKLRWEKEMAELKAEAAGDEVWRKTALDGTYGRTLAIGFSVEGEPWVEYCDHYERSEADLLKAAFEIISDSLHAKGDKPFFIGHNVTFDLKFLFRRAVILGVQPPFTLPFDGRHGSQYYCTSQAWCGFREYISLDNLCKALGIQGKDGFDGSMVCDAFYAGEHDKIREYCADDVRRVIEAHKRLTFSE